MNNFQNITPEDPRLTAYALGEITDVAEKVALEEAIAKSPELAAAVEDIRATAELLGDAFTKETTALGEEGPALIASPSDVPAASQGRDACPQASSQKVIRFPVWLGLATAATVAAMIGGYTVLNEEPRVREVGQLPARAIPVERIETQSASTAQPELEPEIQTSENAFNNLSIQTEELTYLGHDKPELTSAPGLELLGADFAVKNEAMIGASDALVLNKEIDFYGSRGFPLEEGTLPMESFAEPPAPRPRVSVPQSPLKAATSSDFQSVALPPVERESDKALGLTGSARTAYESEFVFRGKQMEGSMSQLSAGLAVSPGNQARDKSVNLYTEGRLAQPAQGSHYSVTDAGAGISLDEVLQPEVANSVNTKMESQPASNQEKLSEVNRSWNRPQVYPKSFARPTKDFFSANSVMPRPAPEPPLSPPPSDYHVQREPSNTEGYLPTADNAFESPRVTPLSTFSIDVDTASYANVRRLIERGQLPPPDAVRIEELVNYFPYDYPAPGPEAEHPLAVFVDAAPAPWAPEHQLIRVGMKAQDIAWEARPASNLVFLLDVSGSMNRPNKLPLVKEALSKLIRRLDERDRVAIVVYAGASGLVLPSTTANNQETISHALNNLKAGGSTNGGQGLALAYKVAKENLLEEGNNRIILCTDGDFNVGVSDKGEIASMAAEHAKDGIYLTVLGFGMGNYKDDMLETLSNRGDGNYAYIDSEKEARKVFIEQAAGTLLTVAKDVKLQVEFNPAVVKAYRLIGYENRILAARDFNDDTKDAGEVGAGHSVTALYEVVPVGVQLDESLADIDPLKYQGGKSKVESQKSKARLEVEDGNQGKATDELSPLDVGLLADEVLTIKVRYKLPESDTSTKLEFPLEADQVGQDFAEAATDFRFAAAVAELGLVLRNSPHKGSASLTHARNIAEGALGVDPGGHRSDFIELIEQAQRIQNTKD